MDTLATADTRHNQEQLTETYEKIRQWTDTAHRFETEADDARRLVRLLGDEIVRLRHVFDPIRTHHTTHTWEGIAADHSRHRLDQHEYEYAAGLRRMSWLVDELEARAIYASRAADSTRDSIDSARRRAWTLEVGSA